MKAYVPHLDVTLYDGDNITIKWYDGLREVDVDNIKLRECGRPCANTTYGQTCKARHCINENGWCLHNKLKEIVIRGRHAHINKVTEI